MYWQVRGTDCTCSLATHLLTVSLVPFLPAVHTPHWVVSCIWIELLGVLRSWRCSVMPIMQFTCICTHTHTCNHGDNGLVGTHSCNHGDKCELSAVRMQCLMYMYVWAYKGGSQWLHGCRVWYVHLLPRVNLWCVISLPTSQVLQCMVLGFWVLVSETTRYSNG